ncbi:hypothetical protein SFA35_05355 [Pseudomonas sp. HR96]|uniref:hypothetical protein n=1 Tax=Pseudomonas sp. HR96 TaxID=1027966 RepID=UPI002A75BB1C|nr:hypothetical protein [Pseudomonas sp. HR96]WPP00802.1 hypothetical protein SFA35_05355 [Pseudomonas sp. HR96]
MSTQRFIVENNGPNITTVQKLFEESAAYCLRNRIGLITLVVPVKAAFAHTVIADYLGTTVTRCLVRDAQVSLVKQLDLRLAIPCQLSQQGKNGLVVAAFLTLEDLAGIDANPSLQALAFLPWTEAEGKHWMGIWSPAVWGPASWKVPPLSLPLQVEHELTRLTGAVNLRTGLKDPLDKDSALRVFKGFGRRGLKLDAEHIRGWAIKHGWEARHADDLVLLTRQYCA